MKQPYLSIVIPAYNEETNIRLGAIDKVLRYMEDRTYSWEIILVDDGSTDATRELLDAYGSSESDHRETGRIRIIHNPHQGKAATVISGSLSSRGELIVFTDLDQATPIRELEHVFPWFDKGYDIVIGSRSGRRQGAPITRIAMARGFMLLRSIVLGLHGIMDTQCVFKAFRRSVARAIFSKLKLYGKSRVVAGSMVTAGFDLEVLFVAKKAGYRIKEVPVEWHYVETRRVNPIKDSWQGLMDILKIRLNAWKGVYK